jgi:DNA-binding response OmpR family regulator
MRVLIVEDERRPAQVLASALEAEHDDGVVAPTGEDLAIGRGRGWIDLHCYHGVEQFPIGAVICVI